MTTTREPAERLDDPHPTGRAVRLLLRRIHFLAGLLIAPFLAVLAVTGILYAFTPQINDVLYGDRLYVDQVGAAPRPVDEQVQAALGAHPDAAFKSVVVSADPERTTEVVLAAPGLDEHGGDHFSAESLTVYVNPYTAAVQGDLVTVNGRPPAQVWLRELHGNLNLGEPGRLYAEFVASWLPVVVIGGIVLWVGTRRARSRTGRARLRGLHASVGLWAAVGLLVLSATGLTWSKYAGERVDQLIEAVDAKSPSLRSADVEPTAARISLDRAVVIARDSGLEGDLTVTAPTASARPLKINESSLGLPVQKDSVAVDPYTGAVTGRVSWDDYPLLAKLTSVGIAAHSGTLFGLANQLLLALVAGAALVLLVLGYRMWWLRRPRAGGAAAAPDAVWRRMTWPLRIAVLVVAAATAWAMPVFGGSLVLFLVADLALAARRRKTA
ncbi:PepSY domain-containing protein [Actinokineospora soli]